MLTFDPNQVSFAQGEVRVEGVVRKHELKLGKIMTSRDRDLAPALKDLAVRNVPDGFSKVQLPFVFTRSQFFISEAKPRSKVAEHAHHGGDALRFIARGSVVHDGVELGAGDWMYVPQGTRYSLEIGPEGATMCYCYSCCCAGLEDVRDWIVNPAPENMR
jgi:hypothetical protein